MTTLEATPLLDTIAGTVATTLKIPIERLDVDADFDSFGMDSIIAIELMTNLSRRLNISITPALFYGTKIRSNDGNDSWGGVVQTKFLF